MQSLIQSSGNIVLFTAKGHPEIAAAGIKYDQGVSKKFFRRDTNHTARDHETHVRSALSKVTLQVANNTSRKARSYIQAYANKYGGSHLLIEKLVEIRKCHLNILDQETAYSEKTMAMIDEDEQEVESERLSLAQETREGEI